MAERCQADSKQPGNRSTNVEHERRRVCRKSCDLLKQSGKSLQVYVANLALLIHLQQRPAHSCHRFFVPFEILHKLRLEGIHSDGECDPVSVTPSSHFQHVVAACLFLAAKVEEEHRKLFDVIKVVWFYGTVEKRKRDITLPDKLFEDDQIYKEFKTRLLYIERLLLELSDFRLNLEHPYALLDALLAALNVTPPKDCTPAELKNSDFWKLKNTAWCFVNDRFALHFIPSFPFPSYFVLFVSHSSLEF